MKYRLYAYCYRHGKNVDIRRLCSTALLHTKSIAMLSFNNDNNDDDDDDDNNNNNNNNT